MIVQDTLQAVLKSGAMPPHVPDQTAKLSKASPEAVDHHTEGAMPAIQRQSRQTEDREDRQPESAEKQKTGQSPAAVPPSHKQADMHQVTSVQQQQQQQQQQQKQQHQQPTQDEHPASWQAVLQPNLHLVEKQQQQQQPQSLKNAARKAKRDEKSAKRKLEKAFAEVREGQQTPDQATGSHVEEDHGAKRQRLQHDPEVNSDLRANCNAFSQHARHFAHAWV